MSFFATLWMKKAFDLMPRRFFKTRRRFGSNAVAFF